MSLAVRPPEVCNKEEAVSESYRLLHQVPLMACVPRRSRRARKGMRSASAGTHSLSHLPFPSCLAGGLESCKILKPSLGSAQHDGKFKTARMVQSGWRDDSDDGMLMSKKEEAEVAQKSARMPRARPDDSAALTILGLVQRRKT